MKLYELMGVSPGITALIGGGGKTSLMYHLARELPGTVICCTTTKIWPPTDLPVISAEEDTVLSDALQRYRVICAGTSAEQGKLTAPKLPLTILASLADFVLVEADGSAGRPMKAHAPYEPVLPPERRQTILVIGAEGFGKPISQAAHRPQLYARLAKTDPDTPLTPEQAAAVIEEEKWHDMVFVNQVEGPERLRAAQRLAEFLSCPVAGGSLHQKTWQILGPEKTRIR